MVCSFFVHVHEPHTTKKQAHSRERECACFTSKSMELMIGLEPTTYALPRRCATDCATSAIT